LGLGGWGVLRYDSHVVKCLKRKLGTFVSLTH
jgi:hypothetical protein